MQDKKIILINGKKGSGKNYLAEKLQKNLKMHNKTSEMVAFADPIKDILCIAFNITREEFDEYKNARTIIRTNNRILTDFRTLIQYFGNDAMKKWFNSDVWVNLFNNHISELDVDYIIVPDFRFEIENVSPIKLHIFDNALNDNDTHASENELNGFNFIYSVNNTGHPDLDVHIEQIINLIL